LYSPAGGSGGSGGISKDFDNPITINGKPGNYVNFYQSLYNLVNPSSWFVEDGSFIRLRDLALTYDFTEMLKVSWVKHLSATFSGRNLLTFTKYHGMDPENTGAFDAQGNTINTVGTFYGVDDFGIPNLKSYQFALNIGF
jgi:TonB-dependent starch-binding outer membrane protein SusC